MKSGVPKITPPTLIVGFSLLLFAVFEVNVEAQTIQLQAVEIYPTNSEVDLGITILEIAPTMEEDGDPDQPIITGNVSNESSIETNLGEEQTPSDAESLPLSAPTGIEPEDTGITGSDEQRQYNESDLEFIQRLQEGANIVPDKDHKGEIDILSTSDPLPEKKKGNVEYTWKVEEGEKAGEGSDEKIATMNKGDLIESITSNSDGGLRSVFVKFDDIQGESADDAGETKAKKPKEIVVVGSKVRDESVLQLVLPTDDPEYPLDSFFDIFVDLDEDDDTDLQLYAVAAAQKDEKIKLITLGEEEVSVTYTVTIHLFGFIPVETSQITTVRLGDGGRGAGSDTDELGRVKVQLPWWHVFGRKTVRLQDIMSAVEEELDDRLTENVTFSFTKIKAQALGAIVKGSKILQN